MGRVRQMKILRRLAFAVIVILLCLALCEGALRLFKINLDTGDVLSPETLIDYQRGQWRAGSFGQQP